MSRRNDTKTRLVGELRVGKMRIYLHMNQSWKLITDTVPYCNTIVIFKI